MKTLMKFTPTSKSKRILGIDPGVATTGFGVIDYAKGDTMWVDHGIITTKAHLPLADRLKQINDELTALCRTYQPYTAGVEKIFFAKNTKTAIDVAHARGVILLTLKQLGIYTHEFTPIQIKMTLTGYGQADKHQIQMMSKATLRLAEFPHPDDAADALAIAICTAQHLHAFESKI